MVLIMAYIEIRTPQKFTNPEGLIALPDLTSGLLLDLDADTLTGDHGAEVSRWEAGGSYGAVLGTIAGSGYGFTHPTLETNGPNGHQSVAFNGEQSIASGWGDPVMLAPNQPATAVVVYADRGSDRDGGRILSGQNPTEDYRNIRHYGRQFATRFRYGTSPESSAALPSDLVDGEWGVYVVRWGEGVGRVDASTGESATATGDVGSINGVFVGSTSGGQQTLKGSVARIQVFDREFSDTDTAAMLSHMGIRYGIPITT